MRAVRYTAVYDDADEQLPEADYVAASYDDVLAHLLS
jgi:hypothetical protein